MATVSIHQPAYLPWLGYLDKIARSDIFVLLDTVQFDRTWFTHRQYVKTGNGPVLLTVPVRKGHLEQTLLQTAIAEDMPWRRKHLTTIEQAYAKAPYWPYIRDELAELYAPTTGFLTDLCIDQLYFWLHELEIGTEVVRASQLAGVTGTRSELLANICTAVEADRYLSGGHGKDYLEASCFEDVGVAVDYQEFRHPVYTQLHGDFLPNMGVIDYIANEKGRLPS